MRNIIIAAALIISLGLAPNQQPTATSIIDRIDENMTSRSVISTSKMTIHGKRTSRTITARSYNQGNNKAFTEYLSPEREKGTKMLKLDNKLWIYSPGTDRTIQISGHMLKQSVMGSDLSYEDMMDERKLTDIYNAKLQGKEQLNGRDVYVLELTAKVDDAAYAKQKIWVDAKHYVPVRQDMYAKSGKLLKRMTLDNIKKFGSRYYPTKMNYKDMLKQGEGTDFEIVTIEFDPTIPEHIFSKASLKK